MVDEIKITPEMIEAGKDALWDTHIYDCDNLNQATPEEAVVEIYQAMALLAKKEPNQN